MFIHPFDPGDKWNLAVKGEQSEQSVDFYVSVHVGKREFSLSGWS